MLEFTASKRRKERMYNNTKRELQFLFRTLNENVFYNQFLTPQIYISVNTRCKNWSCNPFGNKGQYMITVHEEKLEDDFETIVMNMLHQMIHIFCFEHGLKDTSRNMRYHNKIFYQEGMKRGLLFSFEPTKGYITEGIGKEIKILFQKELQQEERVKEAVKKDRALRRTEEKNKPIPPFPVKMKCPVCGMKARAKKKGSLICGKCNVYMYPDNI